MSQHHADEAIRALVRNVAQATVEHCAERAYQGKAGLLESANEIAEEMAELVMECADESPDSEVHAVRALVSGGGA